MVSDASATSVGGQKPVWGVGRLEKHLESPFRVNYANALG